MCVVALRKFDLYVSFVGKIYNIYMAVYSIFLVCVYTVTVFSPPSIFCEGKKGFHLGDSVP